MLPSAGFHGKHLAGAGEHRKQWGLRGNAGDTGRGLPPAQQSFGFELMEQ